MSNFVDQKTILDSFPWFMLIDRQTKLVKKENLWVFVVDPKRDERGNTIKRNPISLSSTYRPLVCSASALVSDSIHLSSVSHSCFNNCTSNQFVNTWIPLLHYWSVRNQPRHTIKENLVDTFLTMCPIFPNLFFYFTNICELIIRGKGSWNVIIDVEFLM